MILLKGAKDMKAKTMENYKVLSDIFSGSEVDIKKAERYVDLATKLKVDRSVTKAINAVLDDYFVEGVLRKNTQEFKRLKKAIRVITIRGNKNKFYEESFELMEGKNIRFVNVEFFNCAFKDISLSDSSLVNCKFIECSFENVKVDNINLHEAPTDIAFHGCVFDGVEIYKSFFKNLSLYGCDCKQQLYFESVKTTKVLLKDCSDIHSIYFYEGEAKEIEVKDCKINHFATLNCTSNKIKIEKNTTISQFSIDHFVNELLFHDYKKGRVHNEIVYYGTKEQQYTKDFEAYKTKDHIVREVFAELLFRLKGFNNYTEEEDEELYEAYPPLMAKFFDFDKMPLNKEGIKFKKNLYKQLNDLERS
ncbi:MAG: hypothetical protein GY679_01510 [Mycoplasma sp.]|nr:hypothetical protein [Mycoplasma sp.]